MAFADPQTLTVGTALTLPRTALALDKGQFRTADSLAKLRIEHEYGSKEARHLVRLDMTKVVSDPIVPAQNKQALLYAYFVVGVPTFGFTQTEAKDAVVGLCTWATAATAANTLKLVGGEV